jgi:glycogen synthase
MFNINIYCTAGVRKRDGTEYEPDTLTGIQNSIDCHLKNLKSKVDKKKDEQFTHSRKVLEAKRKQLKSQGKGNKKNRLLMLMRPKHCMRNSYLVQVCRYFTFQNKRKLTYNKI